MTSTLSSNKFAWLLKREFWEYRGAFFWAPAITAMVMLGIMLLVLIGAEFTAHQHGIQLGGMNLDRVVENVGAGNVDKVHSAIDIGLVGMSMPIGIVFCFVVFFYLLGALYNDRADRSVLFWKSLPLSDTETVLAKVVAAALVAPILATVAMAAMHLGFLILLSLYMLMHGIPSALALLWSPTHLIALWLKMIVSIPVNAIWALPTIGWLLLCSSYVRSKPFIWAVALPFIVLFLAWFVGLLRTMSLSVGWFWTQIIGRLLASVVPFGWMTKASFTADQLNIGVGDGDDDLQIMHHVLSFDAIGRALTMPSMWIGAAAGAAMIAAAIYFRRSRIESDA
jgi:ABC-2 type transport system permease protein